MTNRRDNLKLVIRFSSIIYLIMAVFLVMKTYRGFSGSTVSGGVWNYIQIIVVLLGIFIFFRYNRWILSNRIICIYLLLSVYMFIFGVFTASGISVNSIYNLAMLIYSVNLLIIFYIIGRTSDISKPTIIMPVYFIIALIVILAIIEFLGSGRAWTQRGAVSDVYYVLGLLPLMMVYFDEKKVIIPVIISAIAVAFSGKRAGMIALSIMILFYYLILGSQTNALKQKSKFLLKLFSTMAVIVIGGIYLDNSLGLRIVERLNSLSTDGGSGRDIRWQLVWDAIQSSNPMQYVFGHGVGSITSNIGGHAHNDFLELFYEHGLLGFMMLVLIYVLLIVMAFRMMRSKYLYAAQFICCLICSFMLSMFSYYYIDSTYVSCGMMIFGLILGDYDNREHSQESPIQV